MGETYRLEAKFDNIGGLKVRAPVKSAGVVVGRVAEIRFDPENYVAVVAMQMSMVATSSRAIPSPPSIPPACWASSMSGFEVGGDPEMLKNGDVIKKTQSAVVLEKLISQFMFNKAAEDGGKK